MLKRASPMLKLVLVLAMAGGTALALRGVPQSRVALYAGATFTCNDGVVIEASRINDEYCDCQDGDDEPGTSACEGGHFYCVNRGHRGKYLSSSRVDDGVCDCCDGSDEQARVASQCPYSCKVEVVPSTYSGDVGEGGWALRA